MTATCDTGAVLLRNVLADPASDTARMIYADWLEEQGERDRAEFIRVQCEIEAAGQCRCLPPCSGRVDYWCPCYSLRRREERLMAADVPHPAGGLWSQWEAWLGLDRVAAPTGESWFRRGFVAVVHLPLAAFLEHARDLFSRHPITAVVLTDRAPFGHTSELVSWRRSPGPEQLRDWRECLPDDLYDRLPGMPDTFAEYYRDSDKAHAALSAACVAYGREMAGLPPLE